MKKNLNIEEVLDLLEKKLNLELATSLEKDRTYLFCLNDFISRVRTLRFEWLGLKKDIEIWDLITKEN